MDVKLIYKTRTIILFSLIEPRLHKELGQKLL